MRCLISILVAALCALRADGYAAPIPVIQKMVGEDLAGPHHSHDAESQLLSNAARNTWIPNRRTAASVARRGGGPWIR